MSCHNPQKKTQSTTMNTHSPLLLLLLISIASCRILFYGVTQSGKTSLINSCCGLTLPVANEGSISSTTKEITIHECLGNSVVDTIGIFDYRPNEKQKFDVVDILTMILENAEKDGLSGILWIWGSKQGVGNHELEKIFTTLRDLLPSILPMAIVDNEFPGSKSNVPEYLAKTYRLDLVTVNLENVEALKKWIREHKDKIKIQLPEGWKDYLVKFDINKLREELKRASLMSCDTVQQQLRTLSEKVASIKQPQEQCKCDQDCRRERKYCCDKVLGFCVSKCTESWIDANCQNQVTECYNVCKKAHAEMVASTNQLLSSLNAQYEQINSLNSDLLKTCDKFRLSSTKEEL